MVGEKRTSAYRKKKKEKFFWKAKTEEELEETAAVVDSSTPSTSWDENQLSDLDSKETVGSSWKKMKYADEELLLDRSDDEYTFNTEESKGYRLIDVKNLSTAVSRAHVWERWEIFWSLGRSLLLTMTYFPYHIPKFQFFLAELQWFIY